jgi:hypothetical protein
MALLWKIIRFAEENMAQKEISLQKDSSSAEKLANLGQKQTMGSLWQDHFGGKY